MDNILPNAGNQSHLRRSSIAESIDNKVHAQGINRHIGSENDGLGCPMTS